MLQKKGIRSRLGVSPSSPGFRTTKSKAEDGQKRINKQKFRMHEGSRTRSQEEGKEMEQAMGTLGEERERYGYITRRAERDDGDGWPMPKEPRREINLEAEKGWPSVMPFQNIALRSLAGIFCLSCVAAARGGARAEGDGRGRQETCIGDAQNTAGWTRCGVVMRDGEVAR